MPSSATEPTPTAWTAPAGYQFQATDACRDNPEAAAKPARPGDAKYAVCADQMAIFLRGIEDARRSGKLLLVTFGATWCGWCASLQRQLPGDELFGGRRSDFDLAASFHHIEIGTSATYRGQTIAIPSGEQVLALILRQVPGAKVRAIPFVAVIDPASRQRLVARNIDDLTVASRGAFDADRLRAVLKEAHATVRDGAPSASEPGWLKRKWLRWWHG